MGSRGGWPRCRIDSCGSCSRRRGASPLGETRRRRPLHGIHGRASTRWSGDRVMEVHRSIGARGMHRMGGIAHVAGIRGRVRVQGTGDGGGGGRWDEICGRVSRSRRLRCVDRRGGRTRGGRGRGRARGGTGRRPRGRARVGSAAWHRRWPLHAVGHVIRRIHHRRRASHGRVRHEMPCWSGVLPRPSAIGVGDTRGRPPLWCSRGSGGRGRVLLRVRVRGQVQGVGRGRREATAWA